MVTRIVLNEQGSMAIKEIAAKLKAFNPNLHRFQNALGSYALIELAENLTESKLKVLSEELLSQAEKKKLLLERIEMLAKKLDDESFDSLEARLKKVFNQFEKPDSAKGVSNESKVTVKM